MLHNKDRQTKKKCSALLPINVLLRSRMFLMLLPKIGPVFPCYKDTPDDMLLGCGMYRNAGFCFDVHFRYDDAFGKGLVHVCTSSCACAGVPPSPGVLDAIALRARAIIQNVSSAEDPTVRVQRLRAITSGYTAVGLFCGACSYTFQILLVRRA